MITIRDVARKSGFSATTVSIVLNESASAAGIPPITKNHIKKVARQLGYRPNPFARMLLKNQSRAIAVMVPDIRDPYCSQILSGIEDALYKPGYLLVLTDIQNHRARFRGHLQRLLDRRVEGIVAIANSLYLSTSVLGEFEHGTVPTVVIGRKPERGSLSSVVVDNVAGACEILEHLIKLGHRDIAFIQGPRQLIDTEQRWAGINAAAKKSGLRIDPAIVRRLGSPASSYEGGYTAARSLVDSHQSFTAIMAFDDLTAFGAIRALHDAGRRVPEDCSVVGFDDVAAAEFFNPPLTTMRQPMELMGRMSIEILLAALGSQSNQTPIAPVRRSVKPKLIIRKSSASVTL